ncbi:DUF938 domain-containing protein [Qipengyuania nanhaisediminis]|uniref:DUF938 domain-containing protein n=1 Tax=Qipengyuania nanhaisediminis TaxID=604088 RepID=UPI0038B3C814
MNEKRHAPATLRNREPILAVLRQELPEWGLVLEVASGSGEHAVFFADHLRALEWQPSDPDRQALASIAAYRAEYDGVNLRAPVLLDAAAYAWPVRRADAIVCVNMVHIAPWDAAEGLFAGAARILGGKDLPLILYGPFFEHGVEPASSNLEFDAGLRERDERWGIRDIEAIDALGRKHGLERTARREMPANNLVLVYRMA